MKFDQIDSTELLINNQGFISLVNFIYKFLKENLKSFPEARIKAFTTLLANHELQNFQNSSEESLIFRVTEYCDRINEDEEYLLSLEDEFDIWLNLLIVATGSRSLDGSLITGNPELDEAQYNNFIEVIHRSGIFSIERIIWKLKEPNSAKLILDEFSNLFYTNENFCLTSFISNISALQKGLTPIVKMMTLAFKKRNKEVDQDKVKHEVINQHRSSIMQHCSKLFAKHFQAGQAVRNARDIFTKVTRSFEQRLRKILTEKIATKKGAQKAKSTAQKHQMYSMLHSHSPTENVKIPAFLAGNTELKREAKRLASLGMTRVEGCDKAVVNSPDQNKYKTMATRATKNQGVKI